MTGLHLANYRIDAELGRGGMGIVYRATDTKLNRTVAIKVLPPSALSSDDDRARFFREAQAAAQLHHPNIATVFGIDEAVPHGGGGESAPGGEKRPFIAMEYIEGETLHDRIRKGPFKLPEAVSIAVQVAEALKAAHAKNIVHRDIKSANVMLTPDGVAKVLDFGLAKTNQSTMLTRMGSTLGTVAYMSPEQARGQEVDGRSDLYSLGTMLYEMVTGRLPFAGDYEQAVVYGILNESPEPLTSLRTGVPMELERIVGKLLTKEADYRYQTAADLISDLKSVDVTGSGLSRRAFQTSAGTTLQAGTAVAAGPKAVLPKWAWAVAASLLLIFGAALGRWLAPGQSPADRPTMHVRLEVPGFEAINHPTLSADGRYLAFTADAPQGRTLVIHDLSTNESSIIADVQDEPRLSRFSPDGSWLVYERGELGLGIVQVPGGIPAALSEVGTNPTWLDSETIAFNHTGSIAVIDRISHEVTILYEGQVGTLNALAGGGQILAGLFDPGMPQFGVFDVGKASMTVLGAGMAPRFVPPGHILFQRGDESAGPTDPGPLYVQAYDVANKRLLGSAVEVLDAQESWRLDVSTGGHLVVLPTDANSSPMVVLARLDPTTGSSRPLEWAAPMSDFNGFGLSGDGRWIAYAGNGRAPSINVREIDRPQASPVTLTTREYAWNFRLSTDGSTVWYSQGGPQTTPQVWRQSAEGSGGASVQFDGQPSLLGDVSPDARFWALTNSDGGIRWNFGGLRFVDAVEGTETRVDTTWRVRWGAGRFSPDYRFFAFDGSGASEGAGSFVIGRDGSGPWRVGDMGGPKWSRDGRALFLHRDDSIVRIDLDFSRGVRPSATETIVFESPGLAGFEVLPDGDLLVVTGPGGDRSGRLDLVLDWGRRLEEIAPSR